MSSARVFVGVVAVGLAAFAIVARARSLQSSGESADSSSDAPFYWPNLGGAVDPADDIGQEISNLADETDWYSMLNTQPNFSLSANVAAFRSTIKQCEGTAAQPDPYRVCYAFAHVIQSFANHPAITGEWRGEKLTAQQCAGAGFGPGCVSTAAGAYQITRPTWLRIAAKLGLTDFSPASQDAACDELLRECGAAARLEAGDLVGAIAKARRTWASLPGANYAGQGMRSMSSVQAWYRSAGGAIA